MLKMTRVAALATALFVATGVVPPTAWAQAQPAAPAAPAAAAPADAAAPAAKPAATARATEVVDNPYGFEALLRGSDI
ncbi:MAG: MotA/TolQ/ExbB proton channel family protein, partial [Betaproteobacteria bacterium]